MSSNAARARTVTWLWPLMLLLGLFVAPSPGWSWR